MKNSNIDNSFEREEKRAIAFIGVWGFFTLPLIGVTYLLVKNSEDWKEYRATLWLILGVILLLFIPSFIMWIKVNQKMKKLREQIQFYKAQITNLENSLR